MSSMEIYNRFFLINLNEYPNIGIDLEINKVLLYFLIGIIIATVVYNFRTAKTAALIKKLIRHEATDADRAKTLDELGVNDFGTRRVLSGESGRLASIVKRVINFEKKAENEETSPTNDGILAENESDTTTNDTEIVENGCSATTSESTTISESTAISENFEEKVKPESDGKIDFGAAKFYIDSKAMDDANKVANAKGISVIDTILTCVLMTSIYVFLMFLMPSILELLNNLLK